MPLDAGPALLGYDAYGERPPGALIPYWDMVAPGVVALKDGRLMAVLKAEGAPWFLASNRQRNGNHRLHFGLLQLLADRHTEITEHLCVDRAEPSFDLGPGGSDYAREFWRDYRASCLDEAKTVEWYICVSVKPSVLGTSWRGVVSRVQGGDPVVAPGALRALEAKVSAALSALRWHNVRRLDRREEGGVLFSEVGEALVYVRTLRREPVPVCQPAGTFGGTLYADRVVHGPNGFLVERDGGRTRATFGRMLVLKGYGRQPRVGMFDWMLAPKPGTPLVRARFVMTNHVRPVERAASKARLELVLARLEGAGARAESDMGDVLAALDELASGRDVRGDHAWMVAVHAGSVAELDDAATEIATAVKNAGCHPVPAGAAGEAVYWAQWHGNRHLCNRPAQTSMSAFAFLSPLDGFPAPAGRDRPRWGHPLMWFGTPGLTVRPHDLHQGQNGNTLFVAPTRAGKTLLAGALLTMATFVMGEDGLVFLLDKDLSNALTVRSNGGSYTVARRGEDSGFAPLLRLEDTPEDRSLAADLVRGMVLAADPAPLLPLEQAAVAEAVDTVMALPSGLRSLGAVHALMPPGGAADRLAAWCRGGRKGWAFDNASDGLDLSRGMVGVDLTALLEDEEVLPLATLYLAHLARRRMDGRRRGLFHCEEARFLLTKPYLAQRIEDFALTGGKKNWPIWLVTQQPEHILRHPTGQALLNQFPTRFLLKNPLAQRAAYRGGEGWGDGFHCTEQEFREVSGGMVAGPWSVLLQRPGESERLFFDLTRGAMPRHVPVLSGTPDAVALWDRLCAEMGTDDPGRVRPAFLERIGA